MPVAKRPLEHNTKHKIHKTHNNQHEPPSPYPPATLPSFAMATSAIAMYPHLGMLIPMGPYKVRSVRCPLVAVCSFVWGIELQHIKNKRERDVTLALGGRLLVGQHNNQPKVGIHGRRDHQK
jgi:hypothetical protein